MSDEIVMDAEDLLATIEHVEETLTVMSSVITHLKEQLITNLDDSGTPREHLADHPDADDDTVAQVEEVSAEEFLKLWDYSGLKPN